MNSAYHYLQINLEEKQKKTRNRRYKNMFGRFNKYKVAACVIGAAAAICLRYTRCCI